MKELKFFTTVQALLIFTCPLFLCATLRWLSVFFTNVILIKKIVYTVIVNT